MCLNNATKAFFQTGKFTIRSDGAERVEGRGVTAGGGPRNDAWLFLLSIEHTGNVHSVNFLCFWAPAYPLLK